MATTLLCDLSKPPLGALLAAGYLQTLNETVEVAWGDRAGLRSDGVEVSCRTSNDCCRALARGCPKSGLCGASDVDRVEVDHWLSYALGPLAYKHDFARAAAHLDKSLASLTYLVSKRFTLADFAVFAALHVSKEWHMLLKNNEAPVHVLRWYNFVSSQYFVKNVLESLPEQARASLLSFTSSRKSLERSAVSATAPVPQRNQEGKFVDLPEAEMGKVIVRFPPEASGYLHIGHAKAALLNQYYQEAFKGKLIMRFDDTNPAKENVHFEQVILEDLSMLEIQPDQFTYTSDYFDQMLEYCEKLLRDGKAYVDDTEPELMKQQREQKVECANRSNSIEKNIQMWEEMKRGTEVGQGCCVRAKIDMQSLNGCMRDPTIYRCKNEAHPRTGKRYKVYPTYDFACPIVDAIEGVTHTLRTMEYHDRDAQFYWFIEALGLRRPYIWEYSRLSMTNTVLSKRKLTWFVQEGLVDGWDDPRFPTVRGVLRRGMTVEGLKQFIIAQGSSRSVVFMEWDKIWAFNKKVIDPVAPRYTAVEFHSPVPVLVSNTELASLTVYKHPKNSEVGNKTVWMGPRVLIDHADAEALVEGENTTFINWGNLLIKQINRENGKIISVIAEPNLENKDYKKTLKLTWLCETERAPFTPCYCVYFEHIINKAVLGKDEDFKKYIGHETRKEVHMLGDPELRQLKKGDIIQLQRRGFFKVDVAYEAANDTCFKERPIVLFFIPDGHTKDSLATAAFKQAVAPTNQIKQEVPSERTAADLNSGIAKQGEVVRTLKAEKAAKGNIESAVKVLLELKAEFKKVTGSEWKPAIVDEKQLSEKIFAQGNKVRDLKGGKATKSVIDEQVKILLALKSDYKKHTGKEWQPSANTNENDLSVRICAQGDKVRNLKSQKAEKATIDSEVSILLAMKSDYKTATGKDWKPVAATPPQSSNAVNQESALLTQITEQGDKVRQLKAAKADKTVVDLEVKALLSLKGDYKTLTGKEWKPQPQPQSAPIVAEQPSANGIALQEDLTKKINAQGDIVRNLKASAAPKENIDAAVKILLNLKKEFKNITGNEFPAAGTKIQHTKSKMPTANKEKKPVIADDSGSKKQTRLGLEIRKEENLAEWYSQVLTKGEMIEYYDVSGCYIYRPWSYAIWEVLKNWFDVEIKQLGVHNCYFPIFVSKNLLEKEKTHIADFAPEVAWVTKSGDSDLAEPIAVRPTSETVMYPAYAKWIQSYRDLPIKLNQWNNVVRWEFKHPVPFLRTREFLWQEGHTAYATREEAVREVETILDLYARIYTELLAIPVVKGRKTDKEKFAGGDFTYTVEAYVGANGRAIQGATSHHLGQNFARMFEVVFDDPDTQEKRYVFQNSWGFTTRTIGVMVMVHADNQGLVLPPRVASVQVVIVPCGITVSLADADKAALQTDCDALESELRAAGVRVKGDFRSNYSPGWKFNHWELKGVPIRIELGPKDMKNRQLVAVRRDTGEKIVIKRANAVSELVRLLETIHEHLYNKAAKELREHTVLLKEWSEFTLNLDQKNLILAPFCGDGSCEDNIKAESTRGDAELEQGAPSMGAKSLCIPLEQPAPLQSTDKCIHPGCQRKPQFYTLFGRSY